MMYEVQVGGFGVWYYERLYCEHTFTLLDLHLVEIIIVGHIIFDAFPANCFDS